MDGVALSAVIKSIFKDITNLQDVIEETKTAQKSFEEDEDNLDLDSYITSTKRIVTTLKDSVDKIHNYFDENFKSWSGNVLCKVENNFTVGSEVGKIKLVDLSKLIDPNRTSKLQEAIREPPTFDSDAIVILSDSGSDEPEVTIRPTRSRATRKNSFNNNEVEEKGRRRGSRSILKSRMNGADSSLDDKEETPERVSPKKVQFANKDVVILSRMRNKPSSSSSMSEDEVTAPPKRRRGKPRKRRTSDSEEEQDDDVDIQLDKKFSWKCSVKIVKVPAEELKINYMKKVEDREFKRLMNMKSLKRLRAKKSGTSSDSSDSVKAPKKKTRFSGPKSKRKPNTSNDSESDFSIETEKPKKKDKSALDEFSAPNVENDELNTDSFILDTMDGPDGRSENKDDSASEDDKGDSSNKRNKAKDKKKKDKLNEKDTDAAKDHEKPKSKDTDVTSESIENGKETIDKDSPTKKNDVDKDAEQKSTEEAEKTTKGSGDKENKSSKKDEATMSTDGEKTTIDDQAVDITPSIASDTVETDKLPESSEKVTESETPTADSTNTTKESSNEKEKQSSATADGEKNNGNTKNSEESAKEKNCGDSSDTDGDKKKRKKVNRDREKSPNLSDTDKNKTNKDDDKKDSSESDRCKRNVDTVNSLDEGRDMSDLGSGDDGETSKKHDGKKGHCDSDSEDKNKSDSAKSKEKKTKSDSAESEKMSSFDRLKSKSHDTSDSNHSEGDDDKKKKDNVSDEDSSTKKKPRDRKESDSSDSDNGHNEQKKKSSKKYEDSSDSDDSEKKKNSQKKNKDSSDLDDRDSEKKKKRSKKSKDLSDSDDSDSEKRKISSKKSKDPSDSDDSDSEKKKKSSKKGKDLSDSDDSDSGKKKSSKNRKSYSDSGDSDRGKKKKTGVKDSSDSDNRDKKKEKSKWKKDKLLVNPLYNSDEEMAAFQRKKDRLKARDDESDSDDSLKTRIKKKQAGKKKMKRIVISDSDSENFKKGSSSDSSESEAKKSSSDSEAERKAKEKKKSRKRIKRVKDESSDEDGDKSTRKHIRKVLTKDSLSESTVQAEKDEAARKARIVERQKKYNNIFEEEKLEKATMKKVVLDFNEETREELLVVDDDIVQKLKPHQGKGVQFMWDACFESIDRAKNTSGSGCILAHCMGLGKTLQVITLVHTLMNNNEKTGIQKVLVVCPLSTVLNWVAEFKKWLPDDDCVEVFDLVAFKQNSDRVYQTMEWHRHGGVLIMGYDMFRNLTNETNKRMNKKLRKDFKTALVDPGPDLVICDEGHLLKNEKTSLSISMNKLKTARRIVLTGTPLQNNLKEYWCMVQFVKPNLLGTYKEYLNRFVNPIVNGQYTDSTPFDIQIMRKRSHVLHKLLDGVVQRRDYSVLAPYLPPKYEYVVFVQLTETQVKLYTHYMKEFARKPTSGQGRSFIFVDFQELQRICTHPRVLLDKSIQNKIAQDKKDWENDDESEGSLKEFIDDGTDAESSAKSTSSGSGDESDKREKDKVSTKFKRRTRAMAEQEGGESEVEEVVADHASEWWSQYASGDELDNIVHSGKLHLLFEILQQCEVIGDKVLVFSQSLYSLNVIEYFLSKIDDAAQNGESSLVGGYTGSWSLGLDYFRLDGSSSCDNRAAWCKTFNDSSNIRARLFLISTRAGGLGINLVAANRVIIFDVSWNPSHDIQSIYRVYRFGQTKPSYVYRFVTLGTMEMKIYERQVIKQAISKRVIDEQQIDRHYNQHDLAELYKFEPVPEGDRPIPLVPKDILLGELLQIHEKLIYKYHEHQSLLENKEDEVLDEAERKAAWEEFENEKKNRQLTANVKGLFGNTLQLPVTTIVAALTNIIRREHPTFTLAEINGVIPQLLQEFQGQMAAGERTMYSKIVLEVERMQIEQQQAKFAEYIKMQQQQQTLRLLQKYQQSGNMQQTQADFARYAQQMSQRQQGTNQPSNSSRNANLNMDPNEVVSIDD